MTYFVYALTDPVTGVVHYIGMTNNAHHRYKQHCHVDHYDQSAKGCWIRNLKENKLLPGLKILDIVETEDEVRQREIYWMEYYLKQGVLLTNKLLPLVLTPNSQPLLEIIETKAIKGVKSNRQLEIDNLRVDLERWRKIRRLTMQQLSKMAGVSVTTIVNIEKEHYLPRPSITRKLAAALDVNIDEFVVDNIDNVAS